MNFRQLEYVLEIYQCGSIRKAAEKNYITQPALSQQLHKLENEIGIIIFDRSSSPLKLTYEGEHYIKVIQNIVYQHHQALKWLQEHNTDETGRIILGVSHTRSKIFLPKLLPAFHEQYPNIKIVIQEEQQMSRLAEMVYSGEIDLALVLENNFAYQDLSFVFLKEEDVFLAVPKAMPCDAVCREAYKRDGYVNLSLCTKEPFIILKKGNQLRDVSDYEFAKTHVYPPVVLETSSCDLAHTMAAAGYGLSLIGGMTVKYGNFHDQLSYYPISNPPYAWSFGLIHHPGKFITGSMKLFIDFVQKHANLI